MTEHSRVIGADTLSATLHRAADAVTDMTRAGERAGTLVANRGRVLAPRLTGRLASSVRNTTDRNTAEIGSGLAYANRTHWGYARYGQRAQPFLMDPATQMAPTWAGYYTDEADRILHTVRGA